MALWLSHPQALTYAATVLVALVVVLRMDRGLNSSRFMIATFALLWPLLLLEWARMALEDANRKTRRR